MNCKEIAYQQSNRSARSIFRMPLLSTLISVTLMLIACSGNEPVPTRPIIPDPLPEIAINPPTPMLATRPGNSLITPAPVCTPPPCTADEQYFCPGDCPGGCGTICATPTNENSLVEVIEPTETETAVSQPTTTSTAQPPQPVRIEFTQGTTGTSLQGSLAQGMTQRYILRALSGQHMMVQLSGDVADLALAVIGQDGTVLQSQTSNLTSWQGLLPTTQDYFLDVTSGATRSFALNVTVISIPTPTATINLSPERIQFLQGTTSATKPGTLGMEQSKVLTLGAQAGQRMAFELTSSNAPINITLTYPGTTLFHEARIDQSANLYRTTGQYTLPLDGDYAFRFTNAGTAVTDYTITFSITDSSTQGDTPVRVQFLPGSTSATLPGNISTADGARTFVLTAVSGQIMNVQLLADSTPLFATVSGPNGALLAQQSGAYQENVEKFETALAITLPSTGDYIISLSPIGAAPPPTDFEITFTIQ